MCSVCKQAHFHPAPAPPPFFLFLFQLPPSFIISSRQIAKSKKQRRVAAKKARKAALLNPASLHPTIPVQHQTIDLPHGDGSGGPADENAQVARETLTAEMRIARRKGIKEGNFLKGMA